MARQSIEERILRWQRRMAPGALGGRSESVGPPILPIAALSVFSLPEDPLDNFETAKATRVERTSNQSIPDATPTDLTWQSITYDELDAADFGTDATKLFILRTGTYLLSSNVQFATGTGARVVSIKQNGTSVLGNVTSPAADPPDDTEIQVTTAAKLTAGDYVQVVVYHTAGGALDVVSASGVPFLFISLIR